jgi:NAD(P)H-hydrate repair Nnr-like enzyme with NAD(P)H-hydrate dehydratase domain
MLVLIGTVPDEFGLYIGKAKLKDKFLSIDNTDFPVERGTAAMATAALKVCDFYGLDSPLCIFGGDILGGRGTDLMFKEVNSRLEQYSPEVVTLHYMFPKISYGQPFIDKINSLSNKPQLIADAGGMYLIKTINKAYLFDVFTPDEGELFFLADELAPHPLYVRSELLNKKLSIADLIDKAYKNKNTSKTTIVKGAVDYIYNDGTKIKELSKPNIQAMEAIGGTGDTITGMLSALRYKKDPEADYKALVLNRLIGKKIGCTPATQILEFIKAIPAVLEDYEKNSA